MRHRPAQIILLAVLAVLCTACGQGEVQPSFCAPQITDLYAEADISAALLHAAVSEAPSSDGGETGIVECGFELYEGGYPASGEVSQIAESGNARRIDAQIRQDGTFDAKVTGLLPESEYVFRAFAGNGMSRVYSAYRSFRTVTLPQTFIRIRYIADGDVTTPLLPDDASLDAVQKMFVDNVEIEPCRSFRFETPGKYTVRLSFRDGAIPRRFLCCEGGELLPVEDVYLPDGIVSIPDSAFVGCSLMKCIRIPDECRDFGVDVFRGCTGLVNFDCSYAKEAGRLLAVGTEGIYYAGAEYDGYEAKRYPSADCSRIFTLTASVNNDCYPEQADGLIFSNKTKTIRMERARGVKAMLLRGTETQILPGKVQPSLHYINIASSTIGGKSKAPVLCHCDSLEVAAFQTRVQQLQYICCGCPLLRIASLVTVGSELLEIGDSSFVDCPSLTEMSVPDGVESIGRWCFSGCTGLEKVYFGKGLTKIGAGVLKMPEDKPCSLKKLFIAAEVPPACTRRDFPSGAVIYVPEQSLDLYRLRWPELSSRMEGIDYTNFKFHQQ